VYVDEAGVEDTLSYAWGWSAKGERCPGERLGHRAQRVSMAAAWCCGQVLAPLTFEGYCDSELIEAWFTQELSPVLRAGQVVILDNASFHRHAVLRGLLEGVGCTLLPLPAYSPDLNKIEPGALWADGTPSNARSNSTRRTTLRFTTNLMPLLGSLQLMNRYITETIVITASSWACGFRAAASSRTILCSMPARMTSNTCRP